MPIPQFAFALFAAMSVSNPAAPRSESAWAPFVGCWSASNQAATDAVAGAGHESVAMTCILPVQGDPLSADVVVLLNGAEQRRSRIRADGTSEAFSVQGCSGRETARFSMDGARVFVHGEVACADKPTEQVAAIFAITASGSLLHVRGREDEADPGVAFRTLGVVGSDRVPLALREALLPPDAESGARRDEIAQRVLSSDVLTETARSVPPAVMEIWLAAMISEGTEPPVMNDALQDDLRGAKVPPRVVALLEAFADPAEYEVAFSPDGARTIRVVRSGVPASMNTEGVAGARGLSPLCSDLIGVLRDSRGGVSGPEALYINAQCPGALSLGSVLRATGDYGALEAYARNPTEEPLTRTGDALPPISGGGTESAEPREAKGAPAPREPAGSTREPSAPAQREHPRSEPVRSEPVRREPVRREPVRREPVRREPVRSEPVRSEPVRSEPVQPAPAPVRRPDPAGLHA